MNESDYIKQWKIVWEFYLPNIPFQQDACLFHLGRTLLSDDYKNPTNLRFCIDDDKESCRKFALIKSADLIPYDFYMPTPVGQIRAGFDYFP